MTSPKPTKNSASPQWGEHRPRSAVALAVGVAVLSVPPVIATLVLAALALSALFREPPTEFSSVVPFMAFILVFAGAAVAFGRVLNGTTVRGTWRWVAVFAALSVVSAVPGTMVFGTVVVEEWCESQPGGRGFSGDAALAKTPAACR